MATSSSQESTTVPSMANTPLPPKFLDLMKSARKAKFDAELFMSKIDLLARQYSQGFDEILRQGANETRDEVIRDITTEMDVEVSSYIAKLEDFKAKLKNGSVDQDQDNNGQSNNGPLPDNSPVGIQGELRDRMVKLQEQIRGMEDSNTALQKRFEDATTARNEERVQEVMALQKQLGEALESNRKLKDEMIQTPVPPVVATVYESVQTEKNTEDRVGAFLNKWGDTFPELMDLWEGDKKLLRNSKKLAEKIRILDVKMAASEQALSRLMQIDSDLELINSTLKDYDKFSIVHKSKLRYTNWYPARP